MFGFKSFKKQPSSLFSRTYLQSHVKPAQFTQIQFEIAALWWAQHLPGVKKINFEEINQHSQLENIQLLERLHQFHNTTTKPITKKQLFAFIRILSQKIASLKLNNLGTELSYMQIKHDNISKPPQIIENALKEAKIKASAFELFPSKTNMKIYNNGQIQIGKHVICTNPQVRHYGNNTHFEKAPWAKIYGDKFKCIEINLDTLNGELLAGLIYSLRKFEIQELLLLKDDLNTPITHIYTSISLSDFKGSEQEFLQFSNAQWIDILQDPAQINTYFHESMYIYYHKTQKEWMNTTYFSIGSVVAEKIGDDYYQYTTGPVQIVSATEKGTVGANYLTPISPNDFIIKTKIHDAVEINYLRKSNDVFKVELCDKNGQILSETNTRDSSTASSFGLFSKTPDVFTNIESETLDPCNRM